MLPVVPNLSSYTLPTPIVNTTVPGTAITHVPYDNVAPSVSSASVDNNARGNSNSAPAPTAPPVAEAPPAQVTPLPSVLTGVPSGLNISAQATFIAQLAGQDTSPETQVILVQYEKMVANSNVKYAPSEAFRPQAEPSSVFGRMMQSEKAPTLAAQQAAAQTHSVEIATINAVAAVDPRPAARSAKAQANATETSNEPADEPAPVATYSAPPPPRAIASYQATATRVASQQAPDEAAEIA